MASHHQYIVFKTYTNETFGTSIHHPDVFRVEDIYQRVVETQSFSLPPQAKEIFNARVSFPHTVDRTVSLFNDFNAWAKAVHAYLATYEFVPYVVYTSPGRLVPTLCVANTTGFQSISDLYYELRLPEAQIDLMDNGLMQQMTINLGQYLNHVSFATRVNNAVQFSPSWTDFLVSTMNDFLQCVRHDALQMREGGDKVGAATFLQYVYITDKECRHPLYTRNITPAVVNSKDNAPYILAMFEGKNVDPGLLASQISVVSRNPMGPRYLYTAQEFIARVCRDIPLS